MPELQSQRFRQVRPAAGQRGGTIVGFLVGVVCGLGIAALAAVMVSRSPVPFMNKTGRSPERLAVPKPGEELPDPNKPLYAKDRQPPPTEAPSAETGQPPVPAEGLSILERLFGRAAPEPVPAPPGSEPAATTSGSVTPAAPTAPAATTAPAAPVAAPTTPASQPAPAPAMPSAAKGDARPADPPSAAALPITPEPMAGYVLQAGAFRARDDADGMRVKLALLGFEARVLPAEVNGQTVYRVRIGPYAQADEMNRMRARLAENGIEATVIRQR